MVFNFLCFNYWSNSFLQLNEIVIYYSNIIDQLTNLHNSDRLAGMYDEKRDC